MNYTIELKLVKIKTVQEIAEEIELGVYKGDFYIYESVFKEGDNVLGQVKEFGASKIEKASIEQILKEAISHKTGMPVEEVSLSGKVRLLNVSNASFPFVCNTFDYLHSDQARNRVNLNSQFIPQSVVQPVVAPEPTPLPNEPYVAPEKAQQVAFQTFNEIAASSKFKQEIAGPVASSLKTLSHAKEAEFMEKFNISWDKPGVFATPNVVVRNIGDLDIDYMGSIARNDSRLSKIAMFDEVAKNSDLCSEQVRDFYKSFEWDTAKFNSKKFVTSDIEALEQINFRQPTRSELVFKAMGNMLKQHKEDLLGVSDDRDVDSLLRKHKFEKTLFSYRHKEDNINKFYDEQLSSVTDPVAYEHIQKQKSQSSELKDIQDKLTETFADYKVVVMGKTLRDDFVVQRVEPIEVKPKLKKDHSKVDYSHNPKLMAVIERGDARRLAEEQFDSYKPNEIFSFQSMVELMDANKSLVSSIKLKPNCTDLIGDTKLAIANQRMHDRLIEVMEHKGISVVTLDLPRDFFSNTKFFESIPSFSSMEGRQNTTGEYIKFYQEKNIAYENTAESKRDFIVNSNIQKGIDEAFSNMLRVHKTELANAPWEERDSLVAKHKFEVGFCEWQEVNSHLPEEKQDFAMLKVVHELYQDYMEKVSGLSIKPPFSIAEKTQDILEERKVKSKDSALGIMKDLRETLATPLQKVASAVLKHKNR